VGVLIAIVGPTGSGKTTVARLLESRGLIRIASTTTRRPRPGEVVGRDLHVTTEAEFQRCLSRGDLIAPVRYGTTDYGVRRSHLAIAAARNTPSLIIVEPSGLGPLHQWAQEEGVGFFSVFCTATPDALSDRLRHRYARHAHSAEFSERLACAASESRSWAAMWPYDLIVTNEDSDALATMISTLIEQGVVRRVASTPLEKRVIDVDTSVELPELFRVAAMC
jgi:guanylate kinase